MLAGLLFGLAAVLQVSPRELRAKIKADQDSSSDRFSNVRLHGLGSAFPVIEIALVLALVVSASLVIRICE